MSSSDLNASGSNNGSLGAKADGVVKQAQTFSREMKVQATDLAQSATDVVKAQVGDLSESAKAMASDAGDSCARSVTEQKAVGADYVGNVANIIRRTAYEFRR